VSDGFDDPSKRADEPIQPTATNNGDGDATPLPDIELSYESENDDAAVLLFFPDANAVKV
jgi:hypothetical protein